MSPVQQLSSFPDAIGDFCLTLLNILVSGRFFKLPYTAVRGSTKSKQIHSDSRDNVVVSEVEGYQWYPYGETCVVSAAWVDGAKRIDLQVWPHYKNMQSSRPDTCLVQLRNQSKWTCLGQSGKVHRFENMGEGWPLNRLRFLPEDLLWLHVNVKATVIVGGQLMKHNVKRTAYFLTL